MMSNPDEYYKDFLSADNLKRCYDIAPKRVKQYLDAEINYVLGKISTGDFVLELGCGYGRVVSELAGKANKVIGIDNSPSSILLGKKLFGNINNCSFELMNAINLNFADSTFDVVVCIQNGMSAFHIDKRELILEAIRVTKSEGLVLFSSYSDKFWEHRLEWFRLQSNSGLIFEIDFEKTREGNIICKGGFTATTINEEEFRKLIFDIRGIDYRTCEVDSSSVFFEIVPQKTPQF
ncbi:MAG: class I SAM-dependent methyltransferase [Ignavibacteriae bacterium]|nr:class I SAM-dependent methyltransferase [Ignavibacteriota bacterium]